MLQELTLTLPIELAMDSVLLENHISNLLQLDTEKEEIVVRKLRQSIDARSRQIKVNLKVEVSDSPFSTQISYSKQYADVSQKPQIIIVGSGPAGLFAAIRCIELGYKPVVIERGEDVRARRRDVAAINKDHVVNPESNYCFGEGGAGTYSDGKLYTRSTKRGDIRRVLEILVANGAAEDILYEAHPHIGTNKLPPLIANIRNSIIEAGGEIHFNTKVIDFILKNNEIKGVITADGKEYIGIGTILATGHSARDIFELCQQKGIFIEKKPFALGVRIEHQQKLIDQSQYHSETRNQYLPAASYSLVTQTKFKGVQRGVFSFCMCPGGFIVPSATSPNELVVNGMSPSRRDSKFANSGLVVSIEEEDLKPFSAFGALAGIELQKTIEQKASRFVGYKQTAPAQRVLDFTKKKVSGSLNETSYQPGLDSLDMREVLPDYISESLTNGLLDFGKKIKGYVSNEAQLIGIESRTSSPVRISRDKETTEHVSTKRLFPCGEGAGYAGGIMSAALDGTLVAEQLIKKYGSLHS